jgi:hypothetical protein
MNRPFFDGIAVFSSLYGAILLPYLLLALAFPYAVLRLRDAHNRHPDPQLGFKAILHFMLSLAVLMILTGLTVIVVDAVLQIGEVNRPAQEFPNAAQRTGAAFILSGVLFFGLALLLILVLTTDTSPSLARRMFLGCRCAAHGLVVMFALTALLVVLFQKNAFGRDTSLLEARKTFIAVLLVWGPSSVLHFSLMRLASRPPVAGRRPPEREWQEDGD